MNNTNTVTVEEDPETKELVITLPPELINKLGWSINDSLTWDIKNESCVVISNTTTNQSYHEKT